MASREQKSGSTDENASGSSETGSSSGPIRRPPQGQGQMSSSNAYCQYAFILAVCVGSFSAFYFPEWRAWFGVNTDPGIKWWQSTIIYQVYPRSFQDSDGDGIGDLRGTQDQLDHFEYLGVEAVWLSPVYRSPMVDFGYDVSDYRDIDPTFGTMRDFESLIAAAQRKGIHVIMDFIPNHTSDQHPWFIASRTEGASGRYAQYYVWHDGKILPNGTREPPNNWVSVFGGSMWSWDETRQQYYLHQFYPQQPDLNFRNPQVQKEILEVLRFWLDKGVDGFRADAVRHIYEIPDYLTDQQPSNIPNTEPNEYAYWDNSLTVNQPETHAVVREWRAMFDEYTKNTGREIFLVIEIFDESKNILPYYHSGANFPFNFNLQQINRSCDGLCIKGLVDSWVSNVPKGRWSNWVLGSHDVPRMTQFLGAEYASALNMMLLLLPGTPTSYYGDEIAMKPIHVSYEDTQDPVGKYFGPDRYEKFSRDPSRAPMQWSSVRHAGFSTAEKTWLPVHPGYRTHNVEAQKSDPSGRSPIQLYRDLARLRRQRTFQTGGFDFAVVNKNIFSFIRFSYDQPDYLVAINVGKEPSTDNYRELGSSQMPPTGRFMPHRGYVVYTTGLMTSSILEPQLPVPLDDVTLYPGEGVVIRFWPQHELR